MSNFEAEGEEGMKLQKETGFLGCSCGGSSFYINPNGIHEGVVSLCCSTCKKSCAKITGNNMVFVETAFASLVEDGSSDALNSSLPLRWKKEVQTAL